MHTNTWCITLTFDVYFFNTVHFLMLGIQRIIGPNIPEAKTELIKLIHQQKNYANGIGHDNTSSSNSNSVPKMQLHTRLMSKVRKLYNFSVSQINNFRGISFIY